MNGNIEVAFIGRVFSLTQLKTSAAGKTWAAVKVAVGNGEDVQWLKVAIFGDIAARLAPMLQKGDKIYAEGNLKLDRWKNDAGEKRSGLSVAAWRCEKLGQIGRNKPKSKPRPDSESTPAPTARDWQAPNQYEQGKQGGYQLRRETDAAAGLDDPIPF